MRSRAAKRALIVATTTAAGVIVALVAIGHQEDGGYESPDSAVMATCHASKVLGDYSEHHGRYRIAWQLRGEEPGFGWTAIVEGHSGSFRVIDCKFQGVVHG